MLLIFEVGWQVDFSWRPKWNLATTGCYVMRDIIGKIKSAQHYSIMVDETMDCSRHEQRVICFRFCDSKLQIHEMFTGLHELEQQDAATLFRITKNVLLRFNIDLCNCQRQCYDGAARARLKHWGSPCPRLMGAPPFPSPALLSIPCHLFPSPSSRLLLCPTPPFSFPPLS